MKGNSAVLLILKGQIFRKVKKKKKTSSLVCPVSCMSSSDKGDNNKKNKLSWSSTNVFSIYHHVYKDRRGSPRLPKQLVMDEADIQTYACLFPRPHFPSTLHWMGM